MFVDVKLKLFVVKFVIQMFYKFDINYNLLLKKSYVKEKLSN